MCLLKKPKIIIKKIKEMKKNKKIKISLSFGYNIFIKCVIFLFCAHIEENGRMRSLSLFDT
jgi:hypothetical protein